MTDIARDLRQGSYCVDCHEQDACVLEYDHVDPASKVGEISKSRNIVDLLAEAAKCEVRCRNCHRVKTAERKEGFHASKL